MLYVLYDVSQKLVEEFVEKNYMIKTLNLKLSFYTLCYTPALVSFFKERVTIPSRLKGDLDSGIKNKTSN